MQVHSWLIKRNARYPPGVTGGNGSQAGGQPDALSEAASSGDYEEGVELRELEQRLEVVVQVR